MDEGFATISLPFNFPFDGRDVSQIALSPNGVIYFGGAPSQVDYQPGEQAPMNALAALQADFISTVRVALGADSATFAWTSRLYTAQALGEVGIRVRLESTGTVRDC